MTLAPPPFARAFEGEPFPTESPALRAAPSPVPAGGLLLWLDAGRGVTLDGATARIASWTSRTGSLSASQGTTAAMPVFAANAINGRAAVVFDGADDTLRADGVADLLSGTAVPFSWFTVERAASVGGNRVALSMVGGATFHHAYNSDAHVVFSRANDAGVGAAAIDATGVATTNATVASYVYDGSGLTAWRDGAPVATGGPAGGSFTATAFAIGAAANTSAFYAGAIGEALVYARALSSAERATVEAYLKAKWGTP